MAFSVLGTVIEDTILEEKRCVEKTWPNWWDDLKNKVRAELSVLVIYGVLCRLACKSRALIYPKRLPQATRREMVTTITLLQYSSSVCAGREKPLSVNSPRRCLPGRV